MAEYIITLQKLSTGGTESVKGYMCVKICIFLLYFGIIKMFYRYENKIKMKAK